MVLMGCVSSPKQTQFDAEWEMIESGAGEPKACLNEKDVTMLRAILIRCQGSSD